METLKESKTSLNNNKNEIIVKYRIPISYEEQENNSEEGLKKYSVKILGYNLVEQTNISDGDDIFIVLKDTIKKVLDDKEEEE